ncbi:hypothetical protein BC332_14074 [Capsicum chinense]|nr:hypothetical protein BC332_14074 [Capsicum chinense]
MKTILLFLSLAIILPLSALATCATTDTPTNQVWLGVRDTNGKPLNASNRYWIIPAYHTMDIGGVRLANLDDQQQTTTCPTSVVLSNLPKDDGIAVDNLVSKWPPILHTISTGAKLGIPNDVSSWFQIKHLADRKYKLVFCLESTTYCRDIGFVRQNGYRRLVLSEKPMPFVFKLDDRIGMASCYA